MRDGNHDIASMHVCMFARVSKLEYGQFYLYLLCFDECVGYVVTRRTRGDVSRKEGGRV